MQFTVSPALGSVLSYTLLVPGLVNSVASIPSLLSLPLVSGCILVHPLVWPMCSAFLAGVWAHGDYCRINPKTGGIVMLGRR